VPLVEQRVADRARRLAPEIRDHPVEVRRLREDVGPEAANSAVVELEDGPIPEQSLALRAAQHEPRAADELRSARTDAPAPVHPQMAAEDEISFEAKQKILARGVDGEEAATVQPLRDPFHRSARMRRLHLHTFADEHLQPAGCTGEGITFGHPCHNFVQMPSQLNIAAVARRTGVTAATLRKWEQRYGVLRPVRSTGGQRRYTEVDVGRIEWLKARLAEGYRIAEAAGMLGGASLEAPRTPAKLREALYAALVRSDLAAVRTMLDQAFARGDVSQTLMQVVAPLLTRTGEGWAAGELSVAQEHVLSAEVRARLAPLPGGPASPGRGTAVLACAPGERHELGLLMLAVLLGSDGWRVIFLGADTPVAAAVALAKDVDASAFCLSAAMEERAERLQRELQRVTLPDGTTVVVGGRAVDARAAHAMGAKHLDDDLTKAVRELRSVAA
jgi:MerR family transcriptional regulator, light-induced transcriptional regulator